MRVAILNYPGVVPTSVSGPYDMLDKVRAIASSLHVPCKTFFDVDIVDTLAMADFEAVKVTGHATTRSRRQYDLVIIPAMYINGIENTLAQSEEMVRWVTRQHRGGSDVAAICLGTFLLAATGLLDGKRAVTHWMGAEVFKKMYPSVDLVPDKVIIDEGRIYTCGAAYSFTSLMIYLIEKFSGRDIALAVARVFMIQVHDSGQNAFSIFNLQHDHDDEVIGRVQRHIETHFDEVLHVAGLASKFNMSQRSFIRKFSEVTGNTPLEYIQRVRIEAAKRFFEKGKLTVEAVCRQVGYEDFNSFRNIFKRYAGLTPQAYKRKYGQMFNEAIVG